MAKDFPTRIYTIGHSSHSLSHFLSLLRRHGVTEVVDVRSQPSSRRYPQFSRGNLERGLRACGIEYVFLGKELGGRPEDPSCYVDGRVDFARLAASQVFKHGIEMVLREAKTHVVALMCAEKEPLECHRTLLVARALVDRLTVPVDRSTGVDHAVEVVHILADGNLETYEQSMERLVQMTGLTSSAPQSSATYQRLVAQALALQEKRVAYCVKAPNAPGRQGLGAERLKTAKA